MVRLPKNLTYFSKIVGKNLRKIYFVQYFKHKHFLLFLCKYSLLILFFYGSTICDFEHFEIYRMVYMNILLIVVQVEVCTYLLLMD